MIVLLLLLLNGKILGNYKSERFAYKHTENLPSKYVNTQSSRT